MNAAAEKRQILKYLASAKHMQVATVRDGNPWLCTVYFVTDDRLNFYWLSTPDRRHSQELADDNRAALAVVIKETLPVIGVQAEGVVAVVDDAERVREIAHQYSEKYEGSANSFYDRFVKGINRHWLYVFTPSHLRVFDELDHPDDPSRKII